MAKTFQNYYDEYVKATAKDVQKQKDAQNKIYDSQVAVANDQFKQQTGLLDEQYEQLQRNNEIQRLINERQIQERMSDMGLTKSGLNLTQQTAVQLSAANNANKISLEKQKQVDALALALRQNTSQIEQNRIAGIASIDEAVKNAATSYGNDMITQQIKATSGSSKGGSGGGSSVNSNGLLTGGFGGVKAASNGNVTYWDNAGNSVTLMKYHNPYNNKYNSDAENGTFNNGYQPNNVGGIKLSEATDRDGNVLRFNNALGKPQTLWKTVDNGKVRYWYWDNSQNKYIEYEYISNGLYRAK